MTTIDFLSSKKSTKLIALDLFFNEMVKLYDLNKFPKVSLLNGKKGIGKHTLVIHFLNYIFSKKEIEPYNLKNYTINSESIFYKQLLNNSNQDVLLIGAEENKNIKIEDIRRLKFILSRSSLSSNPRFIIIDEIEFMNQNSANALLKSLEEPSDNNYFILIDNQQADVIKTISSRCIKSNIFLNSKSTDAVTKYLVESNNIQNIMEYNNDITPGLFIQFNEIYLKFNIEKNDPIEMKVSKLLNGYKKSKNKILINLTLFLIDQYFLNSIKINKQKLDFLLNIKSDINKNINDFIYYNLNIDSVLNSIKVKFNNAQK